METIKSMFINKTSQFWNQFKKDLGKQNKNQSRSYDNDENTFLFI
ncbi:MAG: hypothetical protein ACI81G_000299 [Gammaproteobacteria bacterium]|jgi:hypothetical protein